MNFDRSYELLGLLEGDSERKTYIGRENSTGREVLVHLLAGGSEQTLLSMAERYLISNPDAGSRLQIGIFQNQSCLITASSQQFRNIRRALEPSSNGDQFDKVRMWKVPSVNEIPAHPAAAPEVGEFTRMFSNPAPAEPSAPVGEFTRMFDASKPSEPSSPESTRPLGKRPATQDNPGAAAGFTQMFSASPPKSEPGEFTRMFRPGGTPAPSTNSNESWQLDSSQPVLNMNPLVSDGATGAFQVRSTPAPVSVPEQGPSEFTRMMSVPAAVTKGEGNTPVAPPAPPTSAEAASPKKSYLPLIIILNVLFIAAVALVLIFLLKR